jgi:lipid A 3-O-deacylase
VSWPRVARSLLLALAAATVVAAPAGAGVDEVRFGVLGHDVPFPDAHGWQTPNPFAHRYEGGANLNPELLFGRVEGLGLLGRPRPHVGISVNTAGYTSSAYGGLTWRGALGRGGFVEGFLGVAVHDGKLEDDSGEWASLGSRALFRFGGELGLELGRGCRVTVFWEHMSNAGLAEHNDGMDSIGVRLGVSLRPRAAAAPPGP